MTSASGRGSAKKSPADGRHAVAQPGGFDRSLGDRLDDRQVEAGAAHVGMAVGDDDRELTGCAAHVAERLVLREVELLRQRAERARGDPGHRVHELLEPGRVAVELLEHRLAGVLDLVLGLSGLQGLGEIAPESIQPRVGHLEDPADVGRARLVEKDRGRLRCCGSAHRSLRPRDRAARGRRARRGSRGSRARADRAPRRSARPVIASPPSLVNSSSSTADRSVFDAQNPMPTCMMCEGSTCSDILSVLGFPI